MHRTNIATALRRLIGAGIVSGAAALAACSDSATAPQAPAVPGSANAVTVGNGYPPPLSAYVTFRIADTTGATLKEAGWVNIITSPTDTVEVLDNSDKDLDPTVGYVKAKVTKSPSYKACFDMSFSYAGDYWSNTYKACTPEVTSTSQTVSVGVAHAKRRPRIVMLAKNEFGALVGGARYTIEVLEWNTTDTVYEGGSFDRSPVSGNFTFDYFRHPHPVVKVCEVAPPPKHQLTSTKCFSFETKFGGVTTLVFHHEQLIY